MRKFLVKNKGRKSYLAHRFREFSLCLLDKCIWRNHCKGGNMLLRTIVHTEAERKQVVKQEVTRLIPSYTLLSWCASSSRILPPKHSATSPNNVTNENQAFKHMILWGMFYIKTMTRSRKQKGYWTGIQEGMFSWTWAQTSLCWYPADTRIYISPTDFK